MPQSVLAAGYLVCFKIIVFLTTGSIRWPETTVLIYTRFLLPCQGYALIYTPYLVYLSTCSPALSPGLLVFSRFLSLLLSSLLLPLLDFPKALHHTFIYLVLVWPCMHVNSHWVRGCECDVKGVYGHACVWAQMEWARWHPGLSKNCTVCACGNTEHGLTFNQLIWSKSVD